MNQIGQKLFAIHTHADMVFSQDPEQIVYRHKDIMELLKSLGFDVDMASNHILSAKQQYNNLKIYEAHRDKKSEKEIIEMFIYPDGLTDEERKEAREEMILVLREWKINHTDENEHETNY